MNSTEFKLRPAEELMIQFFSPEHIEDACILKASDANIELWLMARDDCCIISRIENLVVSSLTYFAFNDEQTHDAFIELVDILKNDASSVQLGEELCEIFGVGVRTMGDMFS